MAYLVGNQQGTDTLAIDAATLTTTRRYYDPYGNPINTTGSVTTPLGFAGQYTDTESGLIYTVINYSLSAGQAQHTLVSLDFGGVRRDLVVPGPYTSNPCFTATPSGFSDAYVVPCFTNGPNRPTPALIVSPWVLGFTSLTAGMPGTTHAVGPPPACGRKSWQ